MKRFRYVTTGFALLLLYAACATAWADPPSRPAPAQADTALNTSQFWIHTVTPAMIQSQLDAGVDINQTNQSGDAAIVWAGNAMANEDVWRLLIDQGADLTAPLHDHRPAIFWVTKGGTPEAVRLVMAQPGVDIQALDSVGRNSLAHATRLQPDLQVYRLLVDAGIDIRVKDKNGRTAMHEAAMRTRYVHVAEYLHSIGLAYSDLDNNGWDAFLNAAWRNPNYDVVVFLAKQSDLKRVGRDGLNAAMLAAENNPSGKVFKWLLDQGLQVDGRDANGATALIRSGRNSAPVASQLIALGQDVNARDHNGNTAFIMAGQAQTFAPDLFALLSRSGADVHAVNKQGENALLIALRKSKDADNGPQNVLLLLNHYRLDPLQKTKRGDTALSIAAQSGQTKPVLEALIAGKLDVNARDPDGWTPLMRYAAEGYDVEAIDYLLSVGANPRLTDPQGRTAKDLAMANPSIARLPIVGRL